MSICRNCGGRIRRLTYGVGWVHAIGGDCDGCEGCNARLVLTDRGTCLETSGTTAEPVDDDRDLISCAHVYCGAHFFYVAARKHPTMCTDHAAQMPAVAI